MTLQEFINQIKELQNGDELIVHTDIEYQIASRAAKRMNKIIRIIIK